MSRLRAVAWYPLAVLPLGAAVLYAKLQLMRHEGYLIVARAAGEGLTWLDRLTFFRIDLLAGFVLLPLAVLALARALNPRARPALVGAVGSVGLVLFYVQLKAYDSVGTFVDYRLLWSAAQFAVDRPWVADDYLSRAGLVKIGTLLALTLAGAWWAGRRDADRHAGTVPGHATGRCLALGSGALCAIIAALWAPPLPATPYHDSLFVNTLAAYSPRGPAAAGDLANATPEELLAAYRSLTSSPDLRARDPRYWGRAAGYDIAYFVLETVPAACLDPVNDAPQLPHLRRLLDRSFVLRRHHTTYPYTSRALFSLFASWYPLNSSRSHSDIFPDRPLPGLLRTVRRHGYATAIYSTFRSAFENDERMFALLGAGKQVYPSPRITDAVPRSLRTVAVLDRAALHALKDDVARWSAANRRFAIAYLPQLSHGPWADPDWVGAETADPLARCRKLVAVQDGWLGELIDVLERHGRLNRTIIVLTADHGVRTRDEDSDFRGGRIDAYTYHVPAVLFVPDVVPRRMDIDLITSHIDVTPSVLDLLGIAEGRAFEQGLPVWDPGLRRRVTFFLGGHYLGADGFRDRGIYYSWNRMTGHVFANSAGMRFDETNLLPAGSASRAAARSTLRQMGVLQSAWARVVSAGGAATAALGAVPVGP